MICQLTGIRLPKDKDPLWKYMSFEKFVSLLYTKGLFFTRADKYDDRFEGFIPPSVRGVYDHMIGDSNTLEKFRENCRKYILCSCWHYAEEESMAMWEKYHMHNSGIAIKTTFGDFKNCLLEDDDVFLGKIKYINHYEYSVPQNLNEMSMLYTWYFHKRKPFEYEREFRAIIVRYPRSLMHYIDNHGDLIYPDIPLNDTKFPDTCEIGIPFNVEVKKLIREVITSPYIKREEWITDAIRSVSRQYGFNFNVNTSTLLDEPDETVS